MAQFFFTFWYTYTHSRIIEAGCTTEDIKKIDKYKSKITILLIIKLARVLN